MITLFQIIAAGSFLSFFTFIWFQTDFVVQYAKLFGLGRLVKENEWKKYQETDRDPKYPHFLRENYECWFTHMVGCPFCLIGFLSLWFSLAIKWWVFGLIAFIGTFGFLLLMSMYNYVYSKKN